MAAHRLQGAHSYINQTIPWGYFSEENIRFIHNKVQRLFSYVFSNNLIIRRDDIIREMDKVATEYMETIPRMNERVVMNLMRDIINQNEERDKHINWLEHQMMANKLYDPTSGGVRFDPQIIKIPNRFGRPKVGSGTMRFIEL